MHAVLVVARLATAELEAGRAGSAKALFLGVVALLDAGGAAGEDGES